MELLELNALTLAYSSHEGQFRKKTGEPYIVHPISVCGILKNNGIDDGDMLAASLLHDVLEDTETTEGEILRATNCEVLGLVKEVTDVSKLSDGNRAERKRIDREHIFRASDKGKAIKLADLIHNTDSIARYGKGFAKIYLKEKALILEGIIISSEYISLYSEAERVLNEALKIVESE